MKDTPCIGTRWFEEVWNQRKRETIYELLAPESVAHSASSGDLVGPEAWEQMQKEVLNLVPDMRVTVEDVVTNPENTVVRWSAVGKPHEHPPGMTEDECRLHFSGTTWFRIKDGRIVEGWDAWDQTGFVQALQRIGSAPASLIP